MSGTPQDGNVSCRNNWNTTTFKVGFQHKILYILFTHQQMYFY